MCAPEERDQRAAGRGQADEVAAREEMLEEAERELEMFRTRQELRIIEHGADYPLVVQIEALLQRMEQILDEEHEHLARMRRHRAQRRG